MRKSKTNTIHIYLCIFQHMQAYSDIIRNFSNILQTLCNSSIFRNLIYSESWHIQNQRHTKNSGRFKTLVHTEPEIYSESRAIQNPGIFRTGGELKTLSNTYDGVLWETANSYNYFCKLYLFFIVSALHVL